MLPCPDGTACRAPVVTLMWHSCQPQCNTFAMCSWIGCNFCTEAYSHLCVSVLCTLNAWEISSAVAVLLIPKTWARKPWNFASSCIILRFYFFFAWKILDILAAGLNSLLRRASQWPRHVGQNLLQQPMQMEIFPCSGCSSCNIRWCFLSNSRLRCSWSSCSFDITSYSEVPPTQQTEIASLVVGPQLFLQQKPVSPPKRNVKLVQPLRASRPLLTFCNRWGCGSSGVSLRLVEPAILVMSTYSDLISPCERKRTKLHWAPTRPACFWSFHGPDTVFSSISSYE